ncbi:Agamous-like mads-box protein [Thalictrum thalictroides]|uniref:Agamous-like mads-box protein n=1 Tax=Thalictrum thalictroides TaxID=46969 RepID=A0A7J6VRV5_THATH|nr:Agamous-like mads-box protein [Thalictrum thalictroides]
MSTAPKRRNMGRKKIPIEKIQRSAHRQVTFSKRRTGLFKKASELCILCGAEVAIVVFSPAGKVFSFGHPYVESIIDRFLNQHDHMNPNVGLINARIREQQQEEYTEVLNQLQAEKKRGETIEQYKKTEWDTISDENRYWLGAPMDDLGLHELEQMKMTLEELRSKVLDEMRKNNHILAYNSLSDQGFGMVAPFVGQGHHNNSAMHWWSGGSNA